MSHYVQPAFELSAYNCVFCGAYSAHNWSYVARFSNGAYQSVVKNYSLSNCSHCNNSTIWVDKKIVFPMTGSAPLPNEDMPEDVKYDYLEARNILSISPRGASALLRLSIQKLCRHLGEKGDHLNNDIAQLVKKGLPIKLQQALDSVRVIGNFAVHPGQLDLRDDIDTANKLFVFINVIVDNQISQPKIIDQFYNSKVPENLRDEIAKRDNKLL